MTRSLAVALNALGLYAIALVLAAAFAAQLLLDELPCPLCLLQRIQFALLAVGPVLNVRFGPRPSHYAASLLVAAAGAAFDDVGGEALAVVDVVDFDVLVRQEAGGLDEVSVDLQRALVVQVAFGNGRAVQLAPQHRDEHFA